MDLNLVGMKVDSLKTLNLRYIIEADIVDGKTVYRPNEDILEDDTYYLTISGDVVVKAVYSGNLFD